jgi:hypothetical protein
MDGWMGRSIRELAQVTIEAEKSHDIPSARWRSKEISSMAQS